MDEEETSFAGGLEIDESLSLVERVKFYCQSAVSVQRLVYVQELGACAEEIGAAAILSELVPLLNIVSCDPELGIRQALAEQLVPLARVLLAEPDLAGALEDGRAVTAYQVVIERCVPILSRLLNSRNPPEMGLGGSAQLLDAAAEAFIALAGLLRPDDVGPAILTPVLCLAHDDEAEVNRVVATQLLGSLAPVVSSELCCQFILPEIISLADDPIFRVRKAAALKIGALCAVVGPELTAQRLLPVYETLCRDDIWGVRKACVESLSEVTAAAPPDAQTGRLVPLLHELYVDTSRWVRVTACQALGPFLAALPSESISVELLLFFTQLANPANPNASDTDISYFCAFNFPAVVQAVGAARWGEVSEAFRILATNIQWKVRRTLSFSMHELARILGQELAEQELMPTFDYFLKDLDEVKVGVIMHMPRFLETLSPGARLKYLAGIAEVRAETDNWRFRHALALQLADLGPLFPRDAAVETLLPLALDLSTDPVAEVRCAAMVKVGSLIAMLLQGEPEPLPADGPLGGFLRTVCNMASSHSCHRRANCAQICTSLAAALPPAVVSELLLPELVSLASDPVPTVRLLVARLVKQQLLSSQDYASLEPTLAMAESLRADSDRDVLRAIHDTGFEPPPYASKSPGREPQHWAGHEAWSSTDEAPMPAHATLHGGHNVRVPGWIDTGGVLGMGMEPIQLDPPPVGAFARGCGGMAAEAPSTGAAGASQASEGDSGRPREWDNVEAQPCIGAGGVDAQHERSEPSNGGGGEGALNGGGREAVAAGQGAGVAGGSGSDEAEEADTT